MPEIKDGEKFGILEAFSLDLNFGKDIIYTYGPLNVIYSDWYHPSTYALHLTLGIFFTIHFFVTSLKLFMKNYLYLFFLAMYLIAFGLWKDGVFLLYPLMVLIVILQNDELSLSRKVAYASPLAIFSLIKTSFLLPSLVVAFLILAYYFYKRQLIEALKILIILLTLHLTIWIIVGQEISSI